MGAHFAAWRQYPRRCGNGSAIDADLAANERAEREGRSSRESHPPAKTAGAFLFFRFFSPQVE